MTLAVCLGLLYCCRIHLVPIIRLPDGIACKYLPVFLSIEDTINPDQISNSTCRNAAPNLQGTSTMLHCCLQTLIIVPLSSPSANKLPSSTAKYFNISIFFLHPHVFVHS